MNNANAKDQGQDNGDFHHNIIMDSLPFGIFIIKDRELITF